MGIQWRIVNVILGQWAYLCRNIWMFLQTLNKIYLLTCEGVAISAYYYQSSLHIHYGGDVFIALVFRSICSLVLLRSWLVLPWHDLYCVANIKLEPYMFLTLNVPVPYKYGTHQCVEPRFHALELHLSRTSHVLPTRVPRTRAAVRSCPRNSHSHASHGSAHLRAAVPRISMQLKAAAPRISMQLETVVRGVLRTP